MSAPMRRALAFQYLMEHKTIFIGADELIVGEKGPAPKATPTYPELCCHSLQDLDILDAREKIPFAVSAETRELYRDDDHSVLAGPHHARTALRRNDRRMESRLRGRHLHRIHGAARARPHRAGRQDLSQGHAAIFRQDIEQSLRQLDYLNDPQAYAKEQELRAMHICADALIRFAERHAEKARELAQHETDPERQAGTGAHRRGLRARARARAARFLGSAAILLVRASGRHHRAQHVGCLLPRPSRSAPCIRSISANWPQGR